MAKIIVHTARGDELNELKGRLSEKVILLQGLEAALRIIEALWYSADAEARQRAERWSGWQRWQDAIRRAVDWG